MSARKQAIPKCVKFCGDFFDGPGVFLRSQHRFLKKLSPMVFSPCDLDFAIFAILSPTFRRNPKSPVVRGRYLGCFSAVLRKLWWDGNPIAAADTPGTTPLGSFAVQFSISAARKGIFEILAKKGAQIAKNRKVQIARGKP